MIGPFILQRYLRNSFLDERIISCQIKIIGLISCKKYIGKFLIVENLIVEIRVVWWEGSRWWSGRRKGEGIYGGGLGAKGAAYTGDGWVVLPQRVVVRSVWPF